MSDVSLKSKNEALVDTIQCYFNTALWDRSSVPKHQRHRLRKSAFKNFNYEMVHYTVEVAQLFARHGAVPHCAPPKQYDEIVQWFHDVLGYMPDYNRANASMYFRSVEDMCTTILRFRG